MIGVRPSVLVLARVLVWSSRSLSRSWTGSNIRVLIGVRSVRRGSKLSVFLGLAWASSGRWVREGSQFTITDIFLVIGTAAAKVSRDTFLESNTCRQAELKQTEDDKWNLKSHREKIR